MSVCVFWDILWGWLNRVLTRWFWRRACTRRGICSRDCCGIGGKFWWGKMVVWCCCKFICCWWCLFLWVWFWVLWRCSNSERVLCRVRLFFRLFWIMVNWFYLEVWCSFYILDLCFEGLCVVFWVWEFFGSLWNTRSRAVLIRSRSSRLRRRFRCDLIVCILCLLCCNSSILVYYFFWCLYYCCILWWRWLCCLFVLARVRFRKTCVVVFKSICF